MINYGGTPLDSGPAKLARVPTRVRLTWARFESLTAARHVFGSVSYVYVQADRGGRAVRVGKASGVCTAGTAVASDGRSMPRCTVPAAWCSSHPSTWLCSTPWSRRSSGYTGHRCPTTVSGVASRPSLWWRSSTRKKSRSSIAEPTRFHGPAPPAADARERIRIGRGALS